jgi:hypothetical protein
LIVAIGTRGDGKHIVAVVTDEPIVSLTAIKPIDAASPLIESRPPPPLIVSLPAPPRMVAFCGSPLLMRTVSLPPRAVREILFTLALSNETSSEPLCETTSKLPTGTSAITSAESVPTMVSVPSEPRFAVRSLRGSSESIRSSIERIVRVNLFLRQRDQLRNFVLFFHRHDPSTQLGAFGFADDAFAQSVEFHGDLVFGHRIARIALGNIDALGEVLPICVVIVTWLGWNFREECFELVVRDDFHHVHDRCSFLSSTRSSLN